MRLSFFEIVKMRSDTLLKKFLPEFLKFYGYTPESGKFFLYAKGKIPVLLVAHVDTVFAKPPQNVFFDRKYRVYFSPQGLGADDRAGVFGILKLISRGYAPYVLFTDLEEHGAQGAKEFAENAKPEWNLILALDRRGENEAAIYNCDSRQLMELLNRNGFKIVEGSFSDISILCPKTGIAGANLSAGYYNNHTPHEYFQEKALWKTLEKLARIMENLPQEPIRYEPKPSAEIITPSKIFTDFCDFCGKEGVLYDDGGVGLCAECFAHVNGRPPTEEEKLDLDSDYVKFANCCDYCGKEDDLYDANGIALCSECFYMSNGYWPTHDEKVIRKRKRPGLSDFF
jgi:ribosomal protein L37AE/L43A